MADIDTIQPSEPTASRAEYVKTTWVNDVTKLNATNMNHIEDGIKTNNDLAKENASYLDELAHAITDDTNVTFDSTDNTLTLTIGSEPSQEQRTRYFYKKTLEVKPSHTFASDDEINNLFV